MIFQYIVKSKPPKIWYLMALKVINVPFVILIRVDTKNLKRGTYSKSPIAHLNKYASVKHN